MNVGDYRRLSEKFSVDLGPAGKDPVNGYGALDILKYVNHLIETYGEQPADPDPIEPGPTNPAPTNPAFPYPAESEEFGTLESAEIDGEDHVLHFRKSGAKRLATMLLMCCFLATASTASAQVQPVPEPGRYQESDPAAAIISLLKRIESKLDRVDETTGKTLELSGSIKKDTGSIKMDTAAIAKKQQAFLDAIAGLEKSNKANSQSIVDAIRESRAPRTATPSTPDPDQELKRKAAAITSVDFPSKSLPTYNLNESWSAVRDRGKLINHLAGYNSEHRYARQWLNLMTIGQLWYLHDSSHENSGSLGNVRPVPISPVSPAPPVNNCPGGICPTNNGQRRLLFWRRF